MKQIDKIMENWKDILNEGEKIQNPRKAKATAIMLQNQLNYISGKDMNETTSWTSGNLDPNTAGYAGNGEFHKIAIPMVRRTFPELIAHDIVGVQPLTSPVGLAFALRFKADQQYDGGSDQEIGYNTMDPAYTGSYATSAGEALGSKVVPDVSGHPGIGGGLGIGTGKGIKELSMTIEKAQVEAKTRKLRSKWSIEVAQDIQAMHGLDLEEEMMDVLSYEITAEIDRELINKIRGIAVTNTQSVTWDYSAADGRWEAEKYRNFFNLIIRKANRIAIDTRRGAGNFIVASPTLCAALETTNSFTIAPVDNDINTAVTGVARVGSLDGRLSIYRDTFATSDDIIIGYKGPSAYDTGIVYLPYIQLMTARAQFEDSFNPTVGLMSRYAILDNLFGSKNYYIRIRAINLP